MISGPHVSPRLVELHTLLKLVVYVPKTWACTFYLSGGYGSNGTKRSDLKWTMQKRPHIDQGDTRIRRCILVGSSHSLIMVHQTVLPFVSSPLPGFQVPHAASPHPHRPPPNPLTTLRPCQRTNRSPDSRQRVLRPRLRRLPLEPISLGRVLGRVPLQRLLILRFGCVGRRGARPLDTAPQVTAHQATTP